MSANKETEKKPNTKFHYYRASNQLELPIDLSKNRLHDKRGSLSHSTYSSHKIENAINALDTSNSKKASNSLCLKLKMGRKFRLERETRTDTYPFDWEILVLLEALLKARTGSRARGDDLAEKILLNLADHVSEKVLSGNDLSYDSIRLLNNPLVQNAMIYKYSTEVESRINALKNLLEKQPTITWILNACQALDNLILNSIGDQHMDSLEKAGGNSSERPNISDIEHIYDDLVEIRRKSYVEIVNGKILEYRDYDKAPTILFKMPNECGEADAITEQLKKLLPNGSKRITDKKILGQLQETYNRFLLANLKGKEKNSAQKFADDYRKFRVYIDYKEDFTENLRNGVKDEIVEYIKSIYDDLKRLRYIPYRYSTHKPESNSTAFVKERLMNVHDKIQYEFHQPLRLLAIYYSAVHLTCGDFKTLLQSPQILNVKDRFNQLCEQMREALFEIQMNYPSVPSLSICDIPVFKEKCQAIVMPLFAEKEATICTVLNCLQKQEYMENPFAEASMRSYLLLWSCQIAMIELVDDWVEAIMNEKGILTKIFNEAEGEKVDSSKEK